MQGSLNQLRIRAGNVVLRTQRLLSSAGEFLGWEWLVYNPLVHIGFDRAGRRNAPIICGVLRDIFPQDRRIIDVGCGTGRYLQQFKAAGLLPVGVEYSPQLRKTCARRSLAVYPFDVNVPTPHPEGAPFDLAISLEVAEHVPETLAEDFVRYFEGLARNVVFTAAQPGQGGTGHVNEQPKEYWVEKFQRFGFMLDSETTNRVAKAFAAGGAFKYLSDNVSVFRALGSTECDPGREN